MRVLFVPATNKPQVREIDGSLESMQELVGGYIEIVPHEEMKNVLFVINEEGKLHGQRMNIRIYGGRDYIAGDFFMARQDGEEIVGLSDDEITKLKDEMWIRRVYR